MTEYEEFTEKFKIKKTTDECETPKAVYEAVANYVEENFPEIIQSPEKYEFVPEEEIRKEEAE